MAASIVSVPALSMTTLVVPTSRPAPVASPTPSQNVFGVGAGGCVEPELEPPELEPPELEEAVEPELVEPPELDVDVEPDDDDDDDVDDEDEDEDGVDASSGPVLASSRVPPSSPEMTYVCASPGAASAFSSRPPALLDVDVDGSVGSVVSLGSRSPLRSP
jgi:hypothetical protein